MQSLRIIFKGCKANQDLEQLRLVDTQARLYGLESELKAAESWFDAFDGVDQFHCDISVFIQQRGMRDTTGKNFAILLWEHEPSTLMQAFQEGIITSDITPE